MARTKLNDTVRTPSGRAVDRSVRDLPQAAVIQGGIVTVMSYVGRRKAGEYTIPLVEWIATSKRANPFYEQRELVHLRTRHYDDEPGGFGQADRIRDAQVWAINKAYVGYITALERGQVK